MLSVLGKLVLISRSSQTAASKGLFAGGLAIDGERFDGGTVHLSLR